MLHVCSQYGYPFDTAALESLGGAFEGLELPAVVMAYTLGQLGNPAVAKAVMPYGTPV
jgi:hypothetical protein